MNTLILIVIGLLLLIGALELVFLNFTVNELYLALKRYEGERDKK